MANAIEIVDLNGKQPINGGSYNEWGIKLNAIDLELADKLNETIEVVNDINSIGGIVTKFTQLTDTQSSYSGKANKFVKVNSTETGLVFGSSSNTGVWSTISDTYFVTSESELLRLDLSVDGASIYLPSILDDTNYIYQIINISANNYKAYIRDEEANLLSILYPNCKLDVSCSDLETTWKLSEICPVVKTLNFTNYGDLNNSNYSKLSTGQYMMSGVGSNFSNFPITLNSSYTYKFIIDINNQNDIYFINVKVYSDSDTINNGVFFNRLGDSFANSLTKSWVIETKNRTFSGDIVLPPTTIIGGILATDIAYLVGGKIPLSQIQTSLDDYREAYYNPLDDLFYDEPTFITLTEQLVNTMYLDLLTEDTYRWTGSLYKKTGTMQVATTTEDGLMSSADKVKLDTITSDANKVEESTTNGNILIDTVETEIYSHPNHSGDVVSVGDGSTTIQANVVDNTKLAKVPSLTLKGNNTGTLGDVDDLTVTEVQTMLEINKISIKYSLVFG